MDSTHPRPQPGRDEELERWQHRLETHDDVAARAVRSAEAQIRRLATRADAAQAKLAAIREALAVGHMDPQSALWIIRRLLDDEEAT